MGQRSQIYVRATLHDDRKVLIARYFQWNYGERMISRARWTIEAILERMGQSNYYWENRQLEKMARIIDVNFDMHDITMSTDVIEEYREWSKKEKLDFNQCAFFGQDNNDGKLLIDVNLKEQTVKYAFLDDDASTDYIMDAEGYMLWDSTYSHDPKELSETDWREELYNPEDDPEECKETLQTCEENIKVIASSATLMTKEEVDEFLAYKYDI